MPLALLLFLACTPTTTLVVDDPVGARDTADPSGGDSADTDTADGTDTGADTADDTDTAAGSAGDSADSADPGDSADSGGGAPSAPVVTITGVVEVGDDLLSIEFTVDDADGDAEAGALDLVVGGSSVHLTYAELGTWDGRAGSTTWLVEPCDHGETWTLALTATDGAGLPGAAESSYTLSGSSFVVSEDGDGYADAIDVGDLSAPVWICGDVDRAVDTLYIAGQDFDWFTVLPSVTSSYTATLIWTDPAADEDLYLTDGTGGVDEQDLDHSAAQPAEFTHTLNAGTLYFAYVVGWSLPATDYVLHIE